MACSNVFDAFAVATEHLGQEVYVRASERALYMNVVPKETAPNNIGTTQTVFTVGRSEPTTDEAAWESITLASGTNEGACTPTYNEVFYGYNATNYSPLRLGLKGPILCKDDLIFGHNVDDFLEKYMTAIGIRSAKEMDRHLEHLYIDFSCKAIADASFTVGAAGGTYTQDIATSALTQEMLDACAVDLIQKGATNPDTQGYITMGEMGPVWPLLIGLEMSNQLATNNADLRADIRWADAGKGAQSAGATLLQRMGANRTIKNFRHVPRLFPPRYTYNGTAYVRVNTFENTAGTKGYVSTVTAAYAAAPYEAAIVLNPYVFSSQVVRPVNSAPGVKWDPTTFMGDWKFVTGAFRWDTDCVDPLEKKGRHYAEYMHWPKPVFPDYGITIIYKRCPVNSFARVYCT